MLNRTRFLRAALLAMLGVISTEWPDRSSIRAEVLPGQPVPARIDLHGDALPARCLQRLGTMRFRHAGPVHSLAFAPDGKVVASGSQRAIGIWDAATGKPLHLLPGHQGEVTGLAFAPDGRTLASAGWFDQVFLWDVAGGRKLHTLPHGGFVHSVAFGPGGKVVVSASNHRVHFWEVADGKQLHSLAYNGPNPMFSSFALSPDGSAVVTGCYDGGVILWEADTGKERSKLAGHKGTVRSVAFAPDGKSLASGGADGIVRLWEVSTGKELRRFPGGAGDIWSLVFSPDGALVIAGGGDGVVRLWESSTGKERLALPGPGDVSVRALALAPDGKTLAVASVTSKMRSDEVNWVGFDNMVRFWDVTTGRPVRRVDGHEGFVFSLDFSPDGKTLASGSWDRTVRLWEVATGKEQRRLEGAKDFVLSVAFSPDSKTIAAGGREPMVRLWDSATGKEVRQLPTPRYASPAAFLIFTSDRKSLLAGNGHEKLSVWDLAGDQGVRQIPVGTPDRDFKGILYAVEFLKAVPGKQLKRSKIAGDLAYSDPVAIAFAPDGKTAVSTEADGKVRVREVPSGKEIRQLPMAPAYCLAFAPDGKTLASGHPDGTVRLWEVATGKEVTRFEGHRDFVLAVAFSPDGKVLASGGADTSILLWDLVARDG